MGIFGWLRAQVKAAVLGGVQDALEALQLASDPEHLLLEDHSAPPATVEEEGAESNGTPAPRRRSRAK
jgi:hypothetical protein